MFQPLNGHHHAEIRDKNTNSGHNRFFNSMQSKSYKSCLHETV